MKTEKEIKESIDQMDWKAIKEKALDNLCFDPHEKTVSGRYLLGSIFSITPSGKYYQPFVCSNVTDDELSFDGIFIDEYLEEVASQHGMYVDYFEENIFLYVSLENSDISKKYKWVTSDDYEAWKESILDNLSNDNSKALALYLYYDQNEGNLQDIVDAIRERDDYVDYDRRDYLVIIESDADRHFSDWCRNYVNDCLGLSDSVLPYFDFEKFENDQDRGQCLASYDGAEESYEYDGDEYLIYRIS